MNRESILKTISETLADVLDENEVKLTEATSADEVDGWDSIAHVKLIIALESVFDIRFEADEITTPESIGDMITLIKSKMA